MKTACFVDKPFKNHLLSTNKGLFVDTRTKSWKQLIQN